MSPVIVIGMHKENGQLAVIGLYETVEKATAHIRGGEMPDAFYSIVTPAMNSYMTGTHRTVTMTEFK